MREQEDLMMVSSKHRSEEEFCIFPPKNHPVHPVRAQLAEEPLLKRRDQGTRRFSRSLGLSPSLSSLATPSFVQQNWGWTFAELILSPCVGLSLISPQHQEHFSRTTSMWFHLVQLQWLQKMQIQKKSGWKSWVELHSCRARWAEGWGLGSCRDGRRGSFWYRFKQCVIIR